MSENTERDELAERIAGRILIDLGAVVVDGDAADAGHNIAALIDELGYRKPRTITTVEELDALPEGAVIRDNDGDVFEAVRCTGDPVANVPDYNCWDQIAETWPMDSDKIALPVTVLDEASL